MSAGRVEVRRDLAADAERVFAALCDPEHSTPPGLAARGVTLPLRVGSSWEEIPVQGSSGAGESQVSRVEVVACRAPTHLGLRRTVGQAAFQIQLDYYLTPRSTGGTRVEVALGLADRPGCLGRLLLGFLLRALGGGLHEALGRQLEALDARLATPPAAEGGRGPDGGVS